MLQNFNFKIVHHHGSKHTNVDVLSHKPLGKAKADYDFFEEIQDVKLV
jgi:hypothetical protein